MAHPQMFADGDPYLAHVRQICLAFPQAEERISHGRPTFRANKIFAVYGGGTKGSVDERLRYDHAILLLPDPAEREALVQDPRAFVPAYYGPSGWFGWDLAHARTPADQVDWTEVFELVDSSYREVATTTLRVLLDEADLSPPAPRAAG
ncbi:MmcQ/YjbR family DNA-binding protein [Ruania suaedae]|uniref:MmcQ/YjbR family DNA-binding protein n=1 Tax=Ruania suaedae TaxID=2897774 RepID=UPI001E58C245|nr:MmcQ/YjbR family DNA-binding protein [Ruania suaedae]UFU02922.1 MmcQ/YjbR family DNA-binding protein [Ruania suaedae]